MKDLAQFELCTLIPESPIDPSLSQITSLSNGSHGKER